MMSGLVIMKTPISYYGGKQRMLHNILPLLPFHTVYVEPFCGGAAVFFGKPWPEVGSTDHYRECINDIDGNLVNFFRVLRDIPGELERGLALTPYSRAEHTLARDLSGADGADEVERARRYYIQTNCSFAKRIGAGWQTGVYSENHAARYFSQLGLIGQQSARLAGVYIENNPAIKVIKAWDSPQTLFYCDPPYPGAHQGHYSGYSLDDYRELIDALDSCQGSFLLSNYNQDIEPAGAERFEFSADASSCGEGTTRVADRSRVSSKGELGDRLRIEVVWRRFNKVRPRDEIVALYESGAYDCFPAGYFDGERVRTAADRTGQMSLFGRASA